MPQCYEEVDSSSRLFPAHVPGLTPRAVKLVTPGWRSLAASNSPRRCHAERSEASAIALRNFRFGGSSTRNSECSRFSSAILDERLRDHLQSTFLCDHRI